MMNIRIISTVLISGLFVVGCAKLEYVKVPTPTQYSNWTDEDQKKADEMEGVRYYLPRPFVHLKESIPVAQRVAFVSFRLNKTTGYYELVPPQNPPSWLDRVAPRQISITQALAATLATISPSKKTPRQESGPAGDVPDKPQTSKTETTPDSDQRPPSELTARTGFISDTDPVTRLSEKMDVVYLPDFEEQFVIHAKTGLGQADIETRLRNGWAAEVFAQQVDNSNLIPYVIRQVERSSEAAAGIFTTWIPVAAGLPPGTSLPSLDQLTGGARQESGAAGAAKVDANRVQNLLGEVLVFKIAEVRVAQPGIYPILKPREIKQWLKSSGVVSGRDPQETFELFLQQAQVPWIREDMAFIPSPPFTMVGFNITTDIFLAPATERITQKEVSRASADSTKMKQKQAQKIIREVLAKTADASLPGVKAKFNFGTSGSNILVTPTMGKTEIKIKPKAASTLTGSELTNDTPFKNWLKNSFTLTPAQEGKTNVVISKQEVKINIPVALSMLVGKVK